MKTLEERFWEKVKVGSPDECWEWQASTRNGYGQFKHNGSMAYAHRISWAMANGSNPRGGMCVLHRCDNPRCVNPAHLFLGTKRDNTHDAMRKGRFRLAPRRHGEANNLSKLSAEQVVAIRLQYAQGNVSSRQLGRQYSVAKSTILDIVHRKTWIHI